MCIRDRTLDRSVDGMQRVGVPPVWQGSRVLVLGEHGLIDVESGQVAVRFDPRWNLDGFQFWASNALAGPPHSGPGVLAVRYWSLWWHWQWLLCGAGALLLAGGVVALARWGRGHSSA